jgi:ribonucleotide reductase alpha subunit
LQYFIDNSPQQVSRARYSAIRERSIGIGALGWHAYLQKNNIAWESALATSANHKIFGHIRKGLDKANIELGKERGEALDVQSEIIVFDENDKKVTFNSSDLLKIKRNEDEIVIRAFELTENDFIINKVQVSKKENYNELSETL